MSITFMDEFQKDSAGYVRRQLAALSEFRKRVDEQAEATARAKREAELLNGYAQRHPIKPTGPEAA